MFVVCGFSELVAAEISAANSCTFCAIAHGLRAQITGTQASLRNFQQLNPSLVGEGHPRKLVDWTMNVMKPKSEEVKNPSTNQGEAADLIVMVLATLHMNFTTQNYVRNRAFLPFVPEYFRKAYDNDGTSKHPNNPSIGDVLTPF